MSLLSCDCWGGCWGDHSDGWPYVRRISGPAHLFMHGLGIPYGGWVDMTPRDEIRIHPDYAEKVRELGVEVMTDSAPYRGRKKEDVR